MTLVHSFEDIIAELDHVAAIDLRRISDADLQRHVQTILSVYSPLSLVGLNANQIWHRGRLCENTQRFDNIASLSYKRDATGFGRAHVPGFPTFYASRNVGTLLSELAVLDGQHVQFIAARVKPTMRCDSAIIGEYEHVHNSGLSLVGSTESVDFVGNLMNTIGDEANRLILVDAFLAQQYRKVNRGLEYRFTGTFATNLLKGLIEALMYPSVEHTAGMNIAIPAPVFDAKFEVLGSQLHKIRYLGYGQYKLELLMISERIEADGSIVWSTNPAQHPPARFTIRGGYQVS